VCFEAYCFKKIALNVLKRILTDEGGGRLAHY